MGDYDQLIEDLRNGNVYRDLEDIVPEDIFEIALNDVPSPPTRFTVGAISNVDKDSAVSTLGVTVKVVVEPT